MTNDRKEYMKKYYVEHKEEIKSRAIKWNKNNRKQQLETQKRHRQKILDLFNEKQRKRRANDSNAKLKYRIYYYKSKLKKETENSNRYIETLKIIKRLERKIKEGV